MSMSIFKATLSQLDLRFKKFRSLSDGSIKAMVKSLEKQGQLTPIVVCADGPVLVLIDGFKRHQAAQVLGLSSLMVVLICCQGALLKAHLYLLNKKSGFSIIEEGMLIRDLVEVDGLQQVEVAIMLERHKSWVSRRLDMIRRLSPQIVEELKLGLIPPGSAQALARLPQCNQADLSAAIQTHKLQAKECKLLIDLWCKAEDGEGRNFLIKFPQKALEIVGGGEDSTERIDPRIPPKAGGWLKAVRCLERVAAAVRLKSKRQIENLDDEVHQILDKALNRANAECGQALNAARGVLKPASFKGLGAGSNSEV
jgi:ParB/RepB/Spo0J family partition protein